MILKVLLPFQILAEKTSVFRIVAETHKGLFDFYHTDWIAWRRSQREF